MAGKLRYWKEKDGRFWARIAVPAGLRPFLDNPRGELIDPLALAGRLLRPRHVGIKPALRRLKAIAYPPMDRQRPAALERLVILGRVQGLEGRYVRSAHALQLSRWIHKMNP